MTVTTLLNQKGGVGKTSTAYHLSGTLAKDGLRVLLIDNDPQASLTQGFIGPDAMRALDPGRTVAALYRGDEPPPGKIIRETGFANLHLLPGSRHAMDFNVPRPHLEPRSTRHCIRSFLEEVEGLYDHVLIDVPPNLHLCSWAALVASRHVVVPMQPEDFGAQGIFDVDESVMAVRGLDNHRVAILGYLITMAVMTRSAHQFYDDRLRGLYGGLVFENVVPEAVDFIEATMARRPIVYHKARGRGAKIVRALADEFYRRVDEAEGLERGAA